MRSPTRAPLRNTGRLHLPIRLTLSAMRSEPIVSPPMIRMPHSRAVSLTPAHSSSISRVPISRGSASPNRAYLARAFVAIMSEMFTSIAFAPISRRLSQPRRKCTPSTKRSLQYARSPITAQSSPLSFDLNFSKIYRSLSMRPPLNLALRHSRAKAKKS